MAKTTNKHNPDKGLDELIPLSQATRVFPPAADGQPRRYDVVLRWVHDGVVVPGVGRVKLGHQRVGKLIYTTRRAIAKFIADCSGKAGEL